MNKPGPPDNTPLTATRSHWGLVSALAAFSLTSYLTRANISVSSEAMTSALGLSKVQMGEVFSAFLLGYALFQVAGGAIGDRFGPRRTLGLSALLWALTTALTALIPPLFAAHLSLLLVSLCVIRFVLGAGQATTFPVGNLVVRASLPPAKHATGTSIMFLGTSIASAITGPLVSWMTVRFGWQSAFYCTAVPPLLLGLAWLGFAPLDHTRTAPAARTGAVRTRTAPPSALAQGGHTLRSILLQRNVLLLIASYVSEGYVLFIFVFWMYTYLVERRGFSLLDAGWLAGAPWLTALLLIPIGGSFCDRVARLHGKAHGSRAVIMIGYLGSGALLFVAAYATQRWLCLVGLCLSIAALMAAECGFWSFAAHVAEEHVGIVSGVMNTAGILGGIASTMLVPILVGKVGWLPALASGSIMAALCAVLWIFVQEQPSPS